MESHDELPLWSWAVASRPDDPVVELIETGCFNCGASVHEVRHQTGDLCPLCERDHGDA